MRNCMNHMIKFIVLLSLMVICIPSHSGAQDEIRLIIRGDDMGMTQGLLAAFEQAFNNGVLSCGAVQVVAPWFEAAADLCSKNPGWCVGVHLALVGEWQGYRWRPVLPWDKVSSLVDEDGFLFASPDLLLANNPDLDEMEAELRAQVALAVKKGINVQYIDIHYGGLDRDIIDKIAADYDVPVSNRLGETVFYDTYQAPVEEKTAVAVKKLEELEPGLWLWVNHIGIESPEQDALFHTHPEHIFKNDGVGKHRAAELATLMSYDVEAAIMRKGIKVVSYTDLWNELKGE